MKPIKKAVLLILLLSASIQSTLATEPSCEYPNSALEMLRKCDRALVDCDKLLKDKDAKIRVQGEFIDNQGRQIEALEKSNDSILKSPILWFVVGAAATGLAIGIAGR